MSEPKQEWRALYPPKRKIFHFLNPYLDLNTILVIYVPLWNLSKNPNSFKFFHCPFENIHNVFLIRGSIFNSSNHCQLFEKNISLSIGKIKRSMFAKYRNLQWTSALSVIRPNSFYINYIYSITLFYFIVVLSQDFDISSKQTLTNEGLFAFYCSWKRSRVISIS